MISEMDYPFAYQPEDYICTLFGLCGHHISTESSLPEPELLELQTIKALWENVQTLKNENYCQPEQKPFIQPQPQPQLSTPCTPQAAIITSADFVPSPTVKEKALHSDVAEEYMEETEAVETVVDSPEPRPRHKSVLNTVHIPKQVSQPKRRKEKETENVKAQFFLKPARKSPKNYVTAVPDKLYSHPYKYDGKVEYDPNVLKGRTIEVELVDAETKEAIHPTNSKAIEVEKIATAATISEEDDGEALFRICFNICSFHYNRKEFMLSVILVDPKRPHATPEVLTYSPPFRIFARKTDKEPDVWERMAVEKKRKKRAASSSEHLDYEPVVKRLKRYSRH